MKAPQHIALKPAGMSLRSDQTDVQVSTWERAQNLVIQQVAIHQCPYLLTCQDINNRDERLGTYLIDNITNSLIPVDETIKLPAETRKATLFFHGWELIVSEEHQPTYFRSLKDFKHHAQNVADSTKARFTVAVSETAHTGDVPLEFSPVLPDEDETVTTGEFETQLATIPDEVEEQVEYPDEITAPLLAEEPEESLVMEDAEAETQTEDNEFETVSNETDPQYEETDEEPKPAFLARFFERASDEEDYEEGYVETKRKLNIDRKKAGIIACSIGAIALLGTAVFAGVHIYQGAQPTYSITSTDVSNTTMELPAGYSNQPAWSIPIPENARVHSSAAATVIISGKKLTIYSNATGKEIRTITSDWEIASIDETTIDDEPAIVWLNEGHTKLQGWTNTDGPEGKVITVDLPQGAKVSRTDEQIIITAKDAVYGLNKDGLAKYALPQGLTPWSLSAEGLLSIGYDVPAEITDAEGQLVRSVDFQAPEENYIMHQWVTAGSGYGVSIWVENGAEITGDTLGKLTIHSLTDGSVVEIVTAPLSDLEPADGRSWTIGQGTRLAAYGRFIFNLDTGKLQTTLPEDYRASTPKGLYALAKSAEDKTYIFYNNEAGYKLSSKHILAHTPALLITQSGNRIVAYSHDKA